MTIKKFLVYICIIFNSNVFSIQNFLVKESSIINFDQDYKILSSPVLTKKYLVIPAKQNGQYGIITHHRETKNQSFTSLEDKEVLDTPLNSVADQILFKTSEKNNQGKIMIFDPEIQKFTYSSKRYSSISFICSTPEKALFTAKINAHKYKFLFIDIKNKVLKESSQVFDYILTKTNLKNGKWLFTTRNDKKNFEEDLIFLDLNNEKNHICNINSKFLRVLHVLSSNRVLCDIQIKNNKHSLFVFDPKALKLSKFDKEFSDFIRLEAIPENKFILIGSEIKHKNCIYFVDTYNHTLKKWSKNYKWIRSVSELSSNKNLYLAGNQHSLSVLLNIDLAKKYVTELITLKKNFYPVALTDTQLLTAHININETKKTGSSLLLTNLSSRQTKTITHSFPLFCDISALSDDKKVWYVPFKNEQGCWKYLFVDLNEATTSESSLQYDSIQLNTVGKLFRLAHRNTKIIPIFINEKKREIKEFSQCYKKIISPVFYTQNKYLARVQDENNHSVLICFDDKTKQLESYSIVKELKDVSNIKEIIPLFNAGEPNTKVVLINREDNCVIADLYQEDNVYFIPYKKQLLLCLEHI